jgi:acetyltransferase-like isoleucine patch superfamily enzyme
MKNLLKTILRWFVHCTKRYVQYVARLYEIRVDVPAQAFGQNPVIVEGGEDQIRNNIPASVYFNTSSGVIRVGRGAAFGYDVKLVTGKHLDISEAQELGKEFGYVPKSGRDISIGEGCFVGTGAIVIGPVVIGDYSVIGAGSVVTKDVEPRSFYAGIPARKIRQL